MLQRNLQRNGIKMIPASLFLVKGDFQAKSKRFSFPKNADYCLNFAKDRFLGSLVIGFSSIYPFG
ncbi:MAG TPA: hypothetical protein DDW19_04550 [Anaerolineaceae bacterium]|nr:hypothetical protein [Anaerolineaceae bacterium]